MNGKNNKLILVAGARPNFMKIAPLFWELSRPESFFQPLIVHTGQHYDYNMSGTFFRDLDLPEPHYSLGVGPGTHVRQIARVMESFERVLEEIRPAGVMVVGDVNSTLACALAASKVKYEHCDRPYPLLAHVEAGLRSFDDSMPEEINRRLTDALSDLLFVSEPSGIKNLEGEGHKNVVTCFSGIDNAKGSDRDLTLMSPIVVLVGNVMIDSLFHVLPRIKERDPFGILNIDRKPGKPLVTVTIHRPSNVDHPETLRLILETLIDLSEVAQVIFPVHPRTRKRIEDLAIPVSSLLHLAEPLGYLDFLALQYRSHLVITDSGGIQEETTAFNVPCLTVRENTERPITIEQGTNRLVGINKDAIIDTAKAILDGESVSGKCPDLWDGKAAERIVRFLNDLLA
jgi:UDP-N-acetylglucosamine 2-epimerase (non-hydrolysing)